MTYLEKWRKDHPEDTRSDNDIITNICVLGLGPSDICTSQISCDDCWKQEMPDPCIGCKSYVPETDRCSLKIPCWNHNHYEPKSISEEKPGTPEELTADRAPQASIPTPRVLDSGARRQFESGAVRDICAGKGRCDLLPLDVVAVYMCDTENQSRDWVLDHICDFQRFGNHERLYIALDAFAEKVQWDSAKLILEVARQFEDGAVKYGDNNWQKGIPVRCYIDSAVRHYLKFLRGDKDEPHDRAFCWNIICAIWTCKHKPELNDYDPVEVTKKACDHVIKKCDEALARMEAE